MTLFYKQEGKKGLIYCHVQRWGQKWLNQINSETI